MPDTSQLPWYFAYAVSAVSALVIFLAALWLSGLLRNLINKTAAKYPQLDETLFSFLASLARYAILAIAVVLILSRFGVETTSLAAIIGAAGLAIGLALQGTLSNLAAGVMLLVFRPIKIGDFVDAAGHSGTVKAIALFTTELATTDNVLIIIPNSEIWSKSIKNYSVYPTRRAELVFGVSYDADLKQAEQIILSQITADPRSHTDPEPFVKVTNLGDSSVDFTVRVWCNASDFFNLKCDLTRNVKDAFDENGIDIPYPTRTIVNAD